ncbi:MAG: HAD family phosphatase, partial [Verrucomicrobia bacterium]|nr:HAD family phosphatase [Verrucomicrobiota bacterium]
PMIGLQRTLREKGFRTYVLSNTNDMAVEHIRREYPFFGNFDGYVYSFETGVLKPQAGIYEAMEALCGRRGADIIYLDDRPNNAEAGASRGWRTILHELPGRSCELLKRMLPKC